MSTTLASYSVVNSVSALPDQTMVLVGPALDGPRDIPFVLNEGSNPYNLLGISPLAKAYVQAINAGATSVILYRVNGVHAEATLPYKDDTGSTSIFKFRAVSASDAYSTLKDDGTYNNIKVYIDGQMLRVTHTSGNERVYLLNKYVTAAQLGEALNLDAAYGLIEFETLVLQPDFRMNRFTDANMYTAFFDKGSAEKDLVIDRTVVGDYSSSLATLKDRLKAALFGTDLDDQASGTPNSALGLLDFGGIALVDMFYDEDPEFVDLLSKFAYAKTFSGQGCIGVVGTSPLYNPTANAIQARVDKLNQLAAPIHFDVTSALQVADTEARPLSYVQIVAGDTKMTSSIVDLPQPISLAYAYLATQLSYPYHVSVQNKSLEGVSSLSYEFTKEVVDKLSSNGYISIVSSIRRGFVPYCAVTCIGKDSSSSFRNPHYIRISQNISRLLLLELGDLPGEILGSAEKNGLRKRVDDILQKLIASGIIRGYSVSCEFVNKGTEAIVRVSFTPFTDVAAVSSITTLPLNKG